MTAASKLVTAATAAALATTAMVPAAMAAGTVTTQTEQADGQVQHNMLRIPAAGQEVLQSVRGARLALFEGELDAATDMIQSAGAHLNADAAGYAIRNQETGFALPVDSGLQFEDGFTPTDAHAPVITEAGTLLQNGEVDHAIDTMVQAGIVLDIQLVTLPFASTADKLKQAGDDIAAGQIHKANMLLKSIEASVAVQDFAPGTLPAQGYPLSDILPG